MAAWQEARLEIRVLGPLEVREDGRSLPLSGAKQRALLALLLLNANRVLSQERLIERLRRSGRPAEALALWRGPALAEFKEAFARVEGARLEDLRLATLEDRIEADLERGEHAQTRVLGVSKESCYPRLRSRATVRSPKVTHRPR